MMKKLSVLAALLALASTSTFGQADSTMRRAFTPVVWQESGTSGFSQILTMQNLASQGLAGSPSGGSPMIMYGPYTNKSGAMLTVTTQCIESADHCILYTGSAPDNSHVVYGGFMQVPPGGQYLWMMRDWGAVSVTAMGSGLGPAEVGLPPASAFTTPTQTGSTNSYLGCQQAGTDNGDGTFTPSGSYIFSYSSQPIRSDKSSVWGGGAQQVAGPNPGVSTSTCAAGVGTFSGGSGGGT